MSPSRGSEERAAPAALSIRAAGLAYVKLGLPVLRLDGKNPLAGSRGVHDATLDRDRVASWPDTGYNLGIATGPLGADAAPPRANLVVLDVDRHGGTDGTQELFSLEHRHGCLPPTVRAQTGSSGTYYYFTSRQPIGCSAGRLAAGLDVRALGGFVVAPPSVHPDTGRRYAWDTPPHEAAFAELPEWLEERAPLTTRLAAARRRDTESGVIERPRAGWRLHPP